MSSSASDGVVTRLQQLDLNEPCKVSAPFEWQVRGYLKGRVVAGATVDKVVVKLEDVVIFYSNSDFILHEGLAKLLLAACKEENGDYPFHLEPIVGKLSTYGTASFKVTVTPVPDMNVAEYRVYRVHARVVDEYSPHTPICNEILKFLWWECYLRVQRCDPNEAT